MTKYKEYFQRMLQQNKQVFDNFRKLHDEYSLNQDALQAKFNREGGSVLKIIRDWENKLCMQSEKAGYSNYTGGLAEKFQAEVRKSFPKIDYIGIISNKSKTDNQPKFKLKNLTKDKKFILKKISL